MQSKVPLGCMGIVWGLWERQRREEKNIILGQMQTIKVSEDCLKLWEIDHIDDNEQQQKKSLWEKQNYKLFILPWAKPSKTSSSYFRGSKVVKKIRSWWESTKADPASNMWRITQTWNFTNQYKIRCGRDVMLLCMKVYAISVWLPIFYIYADTILKVPWNYLRIICHLSPEDFQVLPKFLLFSLVEEENVSYYVSHLKTEQGIRGRKKNSSPFLISSRQKNLRLYAMAVPLKGTCSVLNSST